MAQAYGEWLKEASSALSRSFSKHQHHANKPSVSVQNRSAAIGDRYFCPVWASEDGMVS
jgi:hypothetical protein